jgi:hypothetical protein
LVELNIQENCTEKEVKECNNIESVTPIKEKEKNGKHNTATSSIEE